MKLTLREASALCGLAPRTLRSRIARGELHGRRVGHAWQVDSRDLPLTEASRRALLQRADQAHEAVEAVLPARARAARKHSSVADLEVFSLGRDLVLDLRHASRARPGAPLREIVHELEEGCLHLTRMAHEFEPERKATALHDARRSWSRAAGLLHLRGVDSPRAPSWQRRLEEELLPRLGGLLRWSQRRSRRSNSHRDRDRDDRRPR